MSTNPTNNAYRDAFFSDNYPNVAGNLINSGDFVWIDPATGDLKALDTDAHAFYLAGVCNDTYKVGAYGTESPNPLGMNVTRVGQRTMFTTNGQTYNQGQQVFIGANAQTITNITGSNKVGIVSALGDGTQKTVVGTGAPQTIVLDVRSKYPVS